MRNYDQFALLFLVFAAIASPQVPRPEAKFVLEVSRPNDPWPHYTPLSDYGVSSLLPAASPSRNAGEASQAQEPATLRLESHVEGNVVQVTASLLFGDYDADDPHVSLQHTPSQQLGSYTLGLHQSLTLSTMAESGLEPFTLTVLPPKPAIRHRPLTTSKAPSVRIRIADQDWNIYTVELLNQSEKTVTAVRLSMPEENGSHGHGSSNPKGLIAPGATYFDEFSIPRTHSTSHGDIVKNPIAPVLFLETVEFADGSYEGNMEFAWEMAARRIGAEIQRRRINEVIEAALADQESGEDAKVERIRAAVAQLAEEPDTALIERVKAQLPGQFGMFPESAKVNLRLALQGEKRWLDSSLEQFARQSAEQPIYTLALWWDNWRKR